MFKEIPYNSNVNYIKLGKGGDKSKRCFEKDLVYIGFGTDEDNLFNACSTKNWTEVYNILSSSNKKPTEVCNILKRFFNDDGNTLWITFENDCMYWCFIEPNSEFRDPNDNGATYKKTKGKWKSENLKVPEEKLLMVDLAGDLTQLHAYRGTSIQLKEDRAQYVINKINGITSPEVTKVLETKELLIENLKKLVQKLSPKDFELLVELIFAQSGWHRISSTGGTTKFHDGVMEQRIINERAAIQVKSTTSRTDFEDYKKAFDNTSYDKFYFIYHSPEKLILQESSKQIFIWDAKKVSEEVLNSGLTEWLINHVI